MLLNLTVSDLAVTCLSITLLLSLNAAPAAQSPQPARIAAETAAKFYRAEVYFGRAKTDGTTVKDSEWKAFLEETVTPRFPDGFTVLDATGQYREKSGRIIAERSMLLIVLYSAASKKESRARIEEIRTAYLKRFDQHSVLWVELPKPVRVSF